MKKVHQLYYTNYGSGYRIEASSIPDLSPTGSVTSSVSAAAVIWETGLGGEGTETVTYSDRVGRFLSARTVPCRQTGDTRPGFWSHVILPGKDGSDGFLTCLSWPGDQYQTRVSLGEKLEDVMIPEEDYDLQEICRKYGLHGDRLSQLILLAIRSCCGSRQAACLIHTETSADACIQAGRECMALIYCLLPHALRKRAGYQAPAEEISGGIRFMICRAGSRNHGFMLDSAAPAKQDADELAWEMGRQLADLFETDPARYEQRISDLCGDTDDFETILWNYYRVMGKKELGKLPAGLLAGNAARLLLAAENDASLLAFTENWFSSVKMDADDERLAAFTELSLKEAQLQKAGGGRAYQRCILRCRSLLKTLSNDEDTFAENLRIISGQYPAIAGDLTGEGAAEGQPEDDPGEDTGKNDLPPGKKKRRRSTEDDYNQKTVVFSFLFAGFYLSLVVSCCGLAAQLAQSYQNPLIFAGGILAVIAAGILLMLLNAVTGLLRREHHISMNGIFMAGLVAAVCAAVASIAGNGTAAAVAGAGTLIFGALLSRR